MIIQKCFHEKYLAVMVNELKHMPACRLPAGRQGRQLIRM